MLTNPLRLGFFLTLVLLIPCLSASALSAQSIDFESDDWTFTGDQTEVTEVDDQQVLSMRSGQAIYKGRPFQDGTIEVDIKNATARSFVYVQFRIGDDGNQEEFYLRPHKSELPDAVQYTPVFRGSSQWQLFHGPGATAAAPLPAGEWTRLRLVVQGRRAALFLGDTDTPQLVVDHLAHEPRAGHIGLRGFVPRGIDPGVKGGTFANLKVKPGVVDYDFGPPVAEEKRQGIIERWQISESFPESDGPLDVLPASVFAESAWQTVDARPSGLVELARFVAKPDGGRVGTVLAKVTLKAKSAGVRRLDLGFSDGVSVFLDGRLLYSADHRYSFDAPRRQGLINFDQASLYLDLSLGEHELVIAVTDRFGGWGLMAKLPPNSGVEVTP